MIHTPAEMGQYRQELAQALNNEFLAKTLEAFASAYPQGRAKAFADYDFDALAGQVAACKDAALPRLEELYQAFKARAEAAGIHVHLAADAAQANRIIAGIAKRAGATHVVKSKSMTAEETFLNTHLEAEGLTVTETDLGEWIIQLRHEGPSHMVMPAIHLSRGQVAELFSQVTGEVQDPEDIDAMVKVARRRLRQAYLEAQVGISGANFAIAESGTIGLVTNEGNARLVTTLPPVHIALVGLDKLVPDLEAALKILQVLPKNATGQAISTYVTWITGPNQCAPGPEGRKEMHIVFLDNGRAALAADPVFGQALRCIRCGACANVCPIYRQVGGHNYGHVYIGAIGLVMTYFYHGRQAARSLVRACLNCQACKKVCPAQIDLPRLIKRTQGLIQDVEAQKPVKSSLVGRVMPNRKLFHFLLRRAYLAQKPLAAKGTQLIRHLPTFLGGADHGWRSLPVVAKVPLRDRWARLAKPVHQAKHKVALFGGCLVDFVYPHMAEAMLQTLHGRRVRVDYPLGQNCCGLPLTMMSEDEAALAVARQNLAAIDPAEYDHVLVLCASCGSHLKENYPKMADGLGPLAVKARQLAAKVIDYSSFMVDVLGMEPLAQESRQVAYHAPCHLCRGLDVRQAPRELIARSGASYVPAKDEEVCCGFGGSFSVDFPELARAIMGRKVENLEATGASVVVTDCPGCVLQIAGGLDHKGSPMKAMHIAELVVAGRKSW